MPLGTPLKDLLRQKEILEQQITEAQRMIEQRRAEVKIHYLTKFLQYPPDLVDAILEDSGLLESYYRGYEQVKSLGIPMDSPLLKDNYAEAISVGLDYRSAQIKEILTPKDSGEPKNPSPEPLSDLSLSPTLPEVSVTHNPNSRESLKARSSEKVHPQDSYIGNFSTLDDTIKGEIRDFFQSQLNLLQNTGVSMWQQRIDTIITLWNNTHPTRKLYKYVSGKSEKIPAGNIWKEKYAIHTIEDAEKAFDIVCPSWFQKKGGKRGRKNKKFAPNKGSQTISPSVPPTSLATSTIQAPPPISVTTSQQTSVPLGEGKSPEKQTESPTASLVAVLNTLFPIILEKYKKEKSVSWQTGGFKLLSIESNGILTEEGGNAVKGKYHKITIRTIDEDQKSYWEALSSKSGREIISRIFIAERSKYPGLSQALLNDVTGTPLFGTAIHEPSFRLMTGTGLSFYIHFPTRDMVIQKKDEGEIVSREKERGNVDQIAFLGLGAALEGYLEWYFDIVLAKGRGILKEDFINIDILKGGKTHDASKGTVQMGAKLGERNKKIPIQRDALHNLPLLNQYTKEHPEAFLSIKLGEGSQPIRILYQDPSDVGLSIEFVPY